MNSPPTAIETRRRVFDTIAAFIPADAGPLTEATPLIGDGGVDSMQLVELCLRLEDLAAELGFAFDWTSESAMSRSRGMFRTAAALADEFSAQMDAQK
jgi:acyl carrier protein